MKVIDIISDNTLNEAGLIGTGLEALGKGAGALYKGAKGVIDSRSLIEKISQHPNFMRRFFQGNPPTAAEVEKVYGKVAGDLVRKDDKLISKAADKYLKDRKAATAAKTATAEKPVSKIDKAAGSVVAKTTAVGAKLNKYVNWALFGSLAFQVEDIFVDAITKIQDGRAKIKDPNDLARYEHDVINAGIARLGGILVLNFAIASAGFGFSKVMPSAFGWLVRQATKLGLGWYNMILSDPRRKDDIVAAFFINIVDAIVGINNPYVPDPDKLVQRATQGLPQDQAATSQASKGQGAAPTDSSMADRNATATAMTPGAQPSTTASTGTPISAGGAAQDRFEKAYRTAVQTAANRSN